MTEKIATREEFESLYASRSGITADMLHGWGLYAVPCECDEPDCRGWQMRHLLHLLQGLDEPATEHIPDDWDTDELLDCLIAEGETDLVQALTRVIDEMA